LRLKYFDTPTKKHSRAHKLPIRFVKQTAIDEISTSIENGCKVR
jgi:hypothetical protein